MAEIRAFGALDVLGPDGTPIDALLAQPKRAALLVYLALSSGGRFVRRDSLLGMFWPDHSEQRARGSLRQALHALRQDLGSVAILTRGDDEVGLDLERVGCDAIGFERAVASSDLLRAAELYRGPLLSGFYLKGSAEFDQWVDGERDRLARMYTRVLEDLADEAALDGDMHMVVEWCRRLALHNPYSTRIALRYMKALEKMGDRAGALAFADRHATRMQRDLEAAPSPDVAQYAARLRARPEGRSSRETQNEHEANPGRDRRDSNLQLVRAALADRYTVERELGAGGMAIVYLAEDLKHHRKVAVKVLRPELAAVMGSERFLKEIEVTANLQHPNILPLYDSGEANSFLYYVMPYVDGESLRERLNREKQLGIEETVGIVKDVARALEYAHERGIIHRDIKPENILLHSGQALVADFGIALAVSQAGGTRLTETGLSLGTPRYMSPEQATAERESDGRTDIYSLGAVAYEMLIGRPPFDGSSAQIIVGKIMSEAVPDMRSMRDTVPVPVQVAIKKALAKLPADRFKRASEFEIAIASLGAPPGETAENVTTDHRRRAAFWRRVATGAVASTILLSIILLTSWMAIPQPRTGQTISLVTNFPGYTGSDRHSFALTPDCSDLIYASGIQGSFARPLSGGEPRLLVVGGEGPMVSPDGSSLAVFQFNQIQTLRRSAGQPVTIAEGTGSEPEYFGGHWGPDGYIYFVPDGGSGIHRVLAEGGGEIQIVTIPEEADGMQGHRFPFVLPGGQALLYTRWTGRSDSAMIMVKELPDGTDRELVAGTTGIYAPTGHLIYATSNGWLRAVRFDLRTLEVSGPSVVLERDVFVTAYGHAHFSICDLGMLIYQSGARSGNLVLLDRQLNERVIVQADVEFPRFSPDGSEIALTQWVTRQGGVPSVDIWVYRLDGTARRITFDGANFHPSWSPAGDSITFISDRGPGGFSMFVKATDGGGDPMLLYHPDRGQVWWPEWSGDGEYIAFVNDAPGGQMAMVFDFKSHTTKPFMSGAGLQGTPRPSPDGRLVAYWSDGQIWVYDRRTSNRTQVSREGGRRPRWSGDGTELYFLNSNSDSLYVATLESGTTARFDEPELLMDFSGRQYRAGMYDVSPDGQHIVLVSTMRDVDMTLVTNWFDRLRQAGPE